MSNKTTEEQLQRLAISSENSAVSKQIIIEFFEWFSPNVNNTDIEEVISILDDFAKSNEHIIQRIMKIRI